MTDLSGLINKWRAPFLQLDHPYSPLNLSDVKVRWNKRMRSRAGVCRPREKIVELNPNLLKQVFQIEEVLVHELCHMAISQRWPTAQPHGQKWKKLMVHMGFPPNRCHNLLPEKFHRQRRWVLHCHCGEHQVTTVIFNRVKKGARYRCLKCKKVLMGVEVKSSKTDRGFFSRIFS